jgi:hypothetical protein
MRAAELRPLGRVAADGWRLSRFVARRGGVAVRRAGRFATIRLAARMGLGAELAEAVIRSSAEAALRGASEKASVGKHLVRERGRRVARRVTRVNRDEG